MKIYPAELNVDQLISCDASSRTSNNIIFDAESYQKSQAESIAGGYMTMKEHKLGKIGYDFNGRARNWGGNTRISGGGDLDFSEFMGLSIPE